MSAIKERTCGSVLVLKGPGPYLPLASEVIKDCQLYLQERGGPKSGTSLCLTGMCNYGFPNLLIRLNHMHKMHLPLF